MFTHITKRNQNFFITCLKTFLIDDFDSKQKSQRHLLELFVIYYYPLFAENFFRLCTFMLRPASEFVVLLTPCISITSNAITKEKLSLTVFCSAGQPGIVARPNHREV